eukprot:2140198-Rhodomonas_salina.1
MCLWSSGHIYTSHCTYKRHQLEVETHYCQQAITCCGCILCPSGTHLERNHHCGGRTWVSTIQASISSSQSAPNLLGAVEATHQGC